MLRGLFVTGTDTGVGKTVATAAVLHRYRRVASLRYWKPIQTGVESDDDTAEVRRLSGCDEDEIFGRGIRLPAPVSPHLAARLSGCSIDIRELAGLVATEPPTTRWIVEGAGGVLVPLNDTQLMTDLMRLLNLPVVVVTRSTLGTINHTLLTLEALRARVLHVVGVLMIGARSTENRIAIERYGCVPVIGEMPWLETMQPDAVASWATAHLDPRHALAECFR